jgi:predicted aldo/keto reductase-like oxidoreductase
MIYKDFQGLKLSALGMGNMRLPVMEGDYGKIDVPQTEKMVAYAMEHGINYYDTAWGYHNGKSETVIGEILSKYPREKFYIATKFPGYDLANMPKVKEIFAEQLKKCRVEYFDFYLFHNVCELNIDAYLDPKYGIYDYLMAQKKAGLIRHLGFSCHGSYDVLKKFLEAYGKDMEFCQLQINFLDWTFQEAEKKVALLESYNIPVWVMEPLRGGKLVSLSEEHEERLRSLRPEETIPAWSFRFLQSIPSIKMILSGMSNFDQLKANIKTFEEDRPLTRKEMTTLLGIADEMLKTKTLPCTACRYCTSHCPQGLDIPAIIKLYNEDVVTEGGFIAPMALKAIPKEKWPTACISCRSCEKVCPQQIKIADMMADFKKKIESNPMFAGA